MFAIQCVTSGFAPPQTCPKSARADLFQKLTVKVTLTFSIYGESARSREMDSIGSAGNLHLLFATMEWAAL